MRETPEKQVGSHGPEPWAKWPRWKPTERVGVIQPGPDSGSSTFRKKKKKRARKTAAAATTWHYNRGHSHGGFFFPFWCEVQTGVSSLFANNWGWDCSTFPPLLDWGPETYQEGRPVWACLNRSPERNFYSC